MDAAEHDKAMPLLLEIGLHCEAFNLSPADFGLDAEDPRLIRGMRGAVNVYHAARSRKKAKKRSEWDKENVESKKILNMIRQGANAVQHKPEHPLEVQVQILTRPKS